MFISDGIIDLTTSVLQDMHKLCTCGTFKCFMFAWKYNLCDVELNIANGEVLSFDIVLKLCSSYSLFELSA